jgi:hypothetical protein
MVAALLAGVFFGNMFLSAVVVIGAVLSLCHFFEMEHLFVPLVGLYLINVLLSQLVFRHHHHGGKEWKWFCRVSVAPYSQRHNR